MGICRFLLGASWIEASRTLRAGLEFIHSCMHLCILYSSGIYWTLSRCLVLGTHCEAGWWGPSSFQGGFSIPVGSVKNRKIKTSRWHVMFGCFPRAPLQILSPRCCVSGGCPVTWWGFLLLLWLLLGLASGRHGDQKKWVWSQYNWCPCFLLAETLRAGHLPPAWLLLPGVLSVSYSCSPQVPATASFPVAWEG